MMNLKIQTSVLKPYLVLVKISILVFCLISCENKKKENLISSQNSINKIYKGRKIIKEVLFKYNKRNLKSIFLLKEEGELGTKGFTKELEVLILNKDVLIDSFSFKNKSLLCDLKILIDEIKVINEDNHQILFFPIIHSCDGEEPKLLKINIWADKKSSYEIGIPAYFQNLESKREFAESISLINFKSNQIRSNAYITIGKETKINLFKIKDEKYNKIDRENYNCFTESDISKIKGFFAVPTKDNFFNSFDKKEDISVEYIISYLKNTDCLNQNISINKINDCTDELKCEINCSYNLTQNEKDDGELSEETLYIYFNKINGKIHLNKLESEGR